MTDSLFGNRWRALLLVALSVAGIVLTLRAERTSESRANRLTRDGLLDEARTIYDARLDEDSTVARLRYNLGTVLLRQGEPEAWDVLTVAAYTPDEELRTKARFNLGLWSLLRAMLAPSTDSVLFHAGNAIEAYKSVLRVKPGHTDAAWNLALAQLVLVESTPSTDMGNIDDPNGAPDLGEVQIIEGPQPFGQDEGFGETASEGEEEAIAGDGLEPLSLAEAAEILGTGHLDPSTMTGKLPLREGRTRLRRGTFVEGPPW